MRVLDLFSGIGGFSLGLERAGMTTVAFCEIEPYCRAVLRKHWPDVPCYEDVRSLTADALRRDGIAVDVICGGFPCQDVSLAGKRAGIKGERTGLWREFRRLIGEIRPRFVIAENVPGILSAGAGEVLGDLAALGYDAFWDCVPASAVGAPHRRDRWWLVANPNGRDASSERQQRGGEQRQQPEDGRPGRLGNAKSIRLPGRKNNENEGRRQSPPRFSGEIGEVAHAYGEQRQRIGCGGTRGGAQPTEHCGVVGFWDDREWIFCTDQRWRPIEPGTFPLAHGVPARLAKCRSAGNAVVPQIPEIIGRAIMEMHP
jgi:DNA (cytosine-5)-methyltransferase 1